MWKTLGVNIGTQQNKLNQQATCLVTSVTCLRGKFKNLEAFFIAVEKP